MAFPWVVTDLLIPSTWWSICATCEVLVQQGFKSLFGKVLQLRLKGCIFVATKVQKNKQKCAGTSIEQGEPIARSRWTAHGQEITSWSSQEVRRIADRFRGLKQPRINQERETGRCGKRNRSGLETQHWDHLDQLYPTIPLDTGYECQMESGKSTLGWAWIPTHIFQFPAR